MDPSAESYGSFSPYHFAGNNPVNNPELNGAKYMYDGTWVNYRGATSFGGMGGSEAAGGGAANGSYSYYGAGGYMIIGTIKYKF